MTQKTFGDRIVSMKHILTPIVLSLVLTACGGGGGGGSSPPAPVVSTAIPATLYDTSYKNFKSYPVDTYGFGTVVLGLGSFLKAGELSYFVATQNYSPDFQDLNTATTNSQYHSDFEFWTINSNNVKTKVSSVKGCLHPRKVVVADFNRDNIPDVFVACHGYDANPFPGEKSKLLLSNGYGNFTMSEPTDVGFFHGATAADINNDGYPDIIVTNSSSIANPVYALINQRNGTFLKDETRVLGLTNNLYFSAELLDLNNDSKIDLIVSGDEVLGADTKILYGDGLGNFGATSTIIPTVNGRGSVVDFTYVVNNGRRQLFLARPYDRTNAQGFFHGWAMQGYDLDSGATTVLADIVGRWEMWFVPKTRNGNIGVGPINDNTFYYY